jgi:glycosyltransferase involved in cell wall biosynthesis
VKKICIVSSCYNEEGNIEELYEEILKYIKPLDMYEWEMLFEDNCSTDNTADILRKIAEKDKRVKVILNMSNYGPDRSGANAIFSACADAIITMASDLEDPPSLIPEYVHAWEEGYLVAMGQYKGRKGNPLLLFCRSAYYKVIDSLTDVKVEKNVTGFGLYDMSVIDRIRSLGEYSIVLRFLCSELGYKIKYIPFEKPKRKAGKSSYSVLKYYNYAVETLVLTSHAPLHLASTLGFFISFFSFVVGLIYLVYKLIYWYEFNAGSAPMIIGMFFIGGVQLFFIGVLGEYLSSAIKRVTKRPFVIEKERINFSFDHKPGKPVRSDEGDNN